MGKGGSDVAKESAEMLLSDDNFASIVAAVEEGRIVFSNLRKVTVFLIPTGVAAIMSIMASMIMGIPAPFLAAQVLWINLVSNGLQDVALAFEPGEKDMLERKPIRRDEGIISGVMLKRIVMVSLLITAGVMLTYNVSLARGVSLEHARTVAVTTIVIFQFFNVWNSRSENLSLTKVPFFGNVLLFYSLAASMCAQLAMIYVPALQWVFNTVPISAMDWMMITLVASSVILLVETDKFIRRKRRTGEGH